MDKPHTGLAISRRATLIRLGVVAAILAAVGLGGGIAAAVLLSPPAVSIPRNITEKVLFPLYAPTKLPGSYRFDPRDITQREQAVIFTVKDGNKIISFSQQAMPKDLSLSDFYRDYMVEVKTISGTPYPTVSGKMKQAEYMGLVFSIAADDTWLMVSSPNASQEELELIAQSIKRQ